MRIFIKHIISIIIARAIRIIQIRFMKVGIRTFKLIMIRIIMLISLLIRVTVAATVIVLDVVVKVGVIVAMKIIFITSVMKIVMTLMEMIIVIIIMQMILTMRERERWRSVCKSNLLFYYIPFIGYSFHTNSH